MKDTGGLDVSRETYDRLTALAALLVRWNSRINLVSNATIADLWDRHIVDSAQLYPLAPAKPHHWVDMGSGGGFPGLVIALMAKDDNPDLRVTLIESDQRKAAFLRTAIRDLYAPATVLNKRVETVEPLAADVVSARAFAPLPALLGHVHRHLRPGGVALLPKGARWEEERSAAEAAWRFSMVAHPSTTHQKAVILQISELSHAQPES